MHDLDRTVGAGHERSGHGAVVGLADAAYSVPTATHRRAAQSVPARRVATQHAAWFHRGKERGVIVVAAHLVAQIAERVARGALVADREQGGRGILPMQALSPMMRAVYHRRADPVPGSTATRR